MNGKRSRNDAEYRPHGNRRIPLFCAATLLAVVLAGSPPAAADPAGNAPKGIRDLVLRLAPGYGLDPNLVFAVIEEESGYDARLVSEKEAAGLMQLIPETAARFNVTDPFQPEQNLRGGMKYLRWLLATFNGDVTLTLAAYNAGEGAVLRWGGTPPYRETKRFLERVQARYPATRHPFDRNAAAPSPLGTAGETVAELPGPQAKRSSIDD